ncbi:hypothetical protein JHK87_042742 [Glycine soja]|nr:hypothetical protein JHK87_042742 [Glycine soja]
MSDQRNIRDHKRRLLAAKYELRRKLYKAFCKDSDLPSDMRDKLRYKLSKLPRNSSFARVRNRSDSIASARERIPIELAFLGKRIFSSKKAIPRPPKPEEKTSFKKKVEGRRRAPSKRDSSLKAATR